MKQILSEEQKKQKAQYAREWRRKNPERAAAHAKKCREKNKDKVRERQKRWLEKNAEKHRERERARYREQPDAWRNRRLQTEFGISLEQYNAMLEAQGGVCALCKEPEKTKGKMLSVDHCHKTGRVRSLLCRGCNVGIGNLKDDPTLMEKAAAYIRKHAL